MKSVFPVLLFALSLTARAWAATASNVDNALLVSARNALPPIINMNEMLKGLQTGVWNSNRTALAVSFTRPRPEPSVIFVFLHQTNGTYLAVDTSGVEGGNLGVLGSRGRKDYDRVETTPIEWLYRDDGRFQIVMRTTAWRTGQHYTVSENLLISRNGTVLWR